MSANQGERGVNIVRASIDSLTFYEVTEDELTLLENGPSSSTYLNLTIALLTLALSFFASIFTVEFKSNTTFIVFLVVALVSMFVGVGYLITWIRCRGTYQEVIKKIKARATPPVLVVNDRAPDEITLEIPIPAVVDPTPAQTER
jgi:hypothetical protein